MLIISQVSTHVGQNGTLHLSAYGCLYPGLYAIVSIKYSLRKTIIIGKMKHVYLNKMNARTSIIVEVSKFKHVILMAEDVQFLIHIFGESMLKKTIYKSYVYGNIMWTH